MRTLEPTLGDNCWQARTVIAFDVDALAADWEARRGVCA